LQLVLSIKAGAVDFIKKPFDRNVLGKKLEEILASKNKLLIKEVNL